MHRAAHILSNEQHQTAAEVRQTYEALLAEMEQTSTSSGPLTMMLSTFRKVTTSYWPGLFHCYDLADLPRTNNDLEQYFGSEGTRIGIALTPSLFLPISEARNMVPHRRKACHTCTLLSSSAIQGDVLAIGRGIPSLA